MHELGYTEQEIKEAVKYIFAKYDANKDDLLDRWEVNNLINASLKSIGTDHTAS